MEKAILVSILAIFVLLAATCVSAVSVEGLTESFELTVNGAEVTGPSMGIEAGKIVNLKVVFQATEPGIEHDVKLKAWIDGYRSDISDSTGRFELVEGRVYSRYLSLEVPSDIDLTEEYNLIVRLSNKDKSFQKEYDLTLQRESYNLEILCVEIPQKTTPGSRIAVDVVLKNRGMHELEDIFAIARIADLGVERKIYFGDLTPEDECDDCDNEDSAERTIYLSIPDDAKSGVYALEVEAYNVDSEHTVKKNLIISGEGEISEVLSGVTSRAIEIGKEVSYDLVIVNSGNKLKVYSLTPEEAKGLIVEVEPLVTVPADSSQTVKVKVRATESAEEGTHLVGINIESDGELVKQVSFSANVEKPTREARSSVVVLTIILAIVFVVLLIILIVLLTRKPAALPESEETSYY